MKLPDIYIIGSGNLAAHLADQFTKQHLPVKGLIARNVKAGRQISRKSKILFLNSVSEIKSRKPVVFCCVTDDAIDHCTNELRDHDALVVHCSGMKPIPENHKNDQCRFGVFYPVLSFSKHKPVDWNGVPVCIEAPDKISFNILKYITGKISARPYSIGSGERAVIHLSAVFSNNFTNLMYMISEDLLKNHHLDFKLMKPLILQTAEKALYFSPETIQTGPGRRGDKKTIAAHRRMLSERSDILKIYNTLTAVIQRRYQP